MTSASMPDLTRDLGARAALKADPRGFLASHGTAVPDHVRIEVHESTPTDQHVALVADWAAYLPERGTSAMTDLLHRAAADEAFKDRLFADPEAVARGANVGLPEGARIHLHEQGAAVRHVVLPPVAPPSGELSDEDLEMVAGGKDGIFAKWGRELGFDGAEEFLEKAFDSLADAAAE